MKEIRKKLLELLEKNKITKIVVDSEYNYISFKTINEAQYTFISGKGKCVCNNEYSKNIIKLFEGATKYYTDLYKLENSYIGECCEECILRSLDDDMF